MRQSEPSVQSEKLQWSLQLQKIECFTRLLSLFAALTRKSGKKFPLFWNVSWSMVVNGSRIVFTRKGWVYAPTECWTFSNRIQFPRIFLNLPSTFCIYLADDVTLPFLRNGYEVFCCYSTLFVRLFLSVSCVAVNSILPVSERCAGTVI